MQKTIVPIIVWLGFDPFSQFKITSDVLATGQFTLRYWTKLVQVLDMHAQVSQNREHVCSNMVNHTAAAAVVSPRQELLEYGPLAGCTPL